MKRENSNILPTANDGNVPVLSSLANRCLELIERGNNTFNLGWDSAIQELIAIGKIEAECGTDGIVRVRLIA
jgi:hypothetical protein